MPFYNIEHSYPLTAQQKQQLAEKITYIHSRAFVTPSMYVQVKYHSYDASENDHFVGGKVKSESSNRIFAFVRSGGRTREQYEKLVKDVENAWYVAVGERDEDEEEGDDKEKKKDQKEESAAMKDAKSLLSVTLCPGIVGREKGFQLPEAGKEGEWVQQNRKEFEHKADMGDEDFKGLIDEIDNREDLKAWRA